MMSAAIESDRTVRFLGNNEVDVLVSSDDTNSAYCILAMTIQPRGGATALHTVGWIEALPGLGLAAACASNNIAASRHAHTKLIVATAPAPPGAPIGDMPMDWLAAPPWFSFASGNGPR